MRTVASTAKPSHCEFHDRPAIDSLREAVNKIRPIEAWLTGGDARRLMAHLRRCEGIGGGVYPLLGELIRAKLADAVPVDRDAVGPEVATGGSRVIFALDGRAPQSRVLFHWGYPETCEVGLSVRTMLGATLLGMKAGRRAPFLRADGAPGSVELLEVARQPEARRRRAGDLGA